MAPMRAVCCLCVRLLRTPMTGRTRRRHDTPTDHGKGDRQGGSGDRYPQYRRRVGRPTRDRLAGWLVPTCVAPSRRRP